MNGVFRQTVIWGFLLGCSALLTGVGNAAEPTLGKWIITVHKARCLKNLDWGKEKTSDPFVEILANDKESTTKWRTRVIRNNLNPEWEQSFVWYDTPANQAGPLLRMTIYDLDSELDAYYPRVFLGSSRLSIHLSGAGDYRLSLNRKFLKGLMPGSLFVSARHVVEEVVTTPNVCGMSFEDAKKTVLNSHLRQRTEFVLTPTPTDNANRVFSQNPSAGKKVKPGATVMMLIHKPMTRSMPQLLGLSIEQARERLAFMTVMPKTFKVRGKRESWFKVVKQSIPTGNQINLNTEVILSVCVPGPDDRVEVPNLDNLTIAEAERALSESCLHPTWKRQESTFEQNSRVVSQAPKAGTQAMPGAMVTVGYGHWANGLTYQSARNVAFGKAESFEFTKPRMRQFRSVKVTRPGYLILRKQFEPFCVKCNFYNARSVRPIEPHGRHFDQALRVTPGKWIFAVYPEFENDSGKKPAVIKVDFVPEFDTAEPNDSFDQATPIKLDARLKIGFAGNGDKDFYAVKLTKAGYLKVAFDRDSVAGRKHTVVPRMRIYDNKQKEIYNGVVDVVRWLPAGTWRLAFECENSKEQFDDQPYAIDVSFLHDLDHMEPNDTTTSATAVDLPSALYVCYHTGDHDFYRLRSKAAGYAIFSHARDLGFLVKLQEYGAHGKKTGPVRHLPCAVRVRKDTLVELYPEMSESYHVKDAALLNVLFVSSDDDPYEPNDVLAQARPVLTGETISALSLPADDVDTYSFRLGTKGKVTLETPVKEKYLVLQAKIYDRSGKALTKILPLPQTIELPAGKFMVQLFQENGLEGLHAQSYQFRIRPEVPGTHEERYRSAAEPGAATRKGIDLAKEAYKLYQAGKYAEAVKRYIQAGRQAPKIASIWNDMGASYFHLNKTTEAEREFLKAVKLRPGYALAWRNLAILHGKTNDFPQAMALSDKAVELEPSAENLRYAGYTYYFAGAKNPTDRQDLWSQAAEYLERSTSLKPDKLATKRLAEMRKFLKQK